MGTIKTMEMVAEEDSESPASFVYISIFLNILAIHRLDAVGTSILTFQILSSEVVSRGDLGGRGANQ
jgi:hypothetical protein